MPALAQITVNYKSYRMTVAKALPKHWNKKKQRLTTNSIATKERESNEIVNNLIDKIEAEAKKVFNEAILEKRDVTETDVKKIFSLSSSKKPESVEVTFMELFAEFIEQCKIDKAPNTIRGYTTVMNFLKCFQEDEGFTITWKNLDVSFIDRLKNYTITYREKQNSYYAKIVRVISTFLHWAEKRNHYKGDLYKMLKGDEPEKEVIFLEINELMELYKYEFEQPGLNSIRDLYCFASFTGLRYSDCKSLRHEDINDGVLTKEQQKTGQVNSLQLNKFAREIIERYKDLPKPLIVEENVTVNKKIKKCLGIIAKNHPPKKSFNREIVVKKVIGKKTFEEIKPLHQAIVFHTSRKTFITNSILMDMNIKALQDMGAPKRDKDLRKYIKITDAYKKKVMENTWDKIG